MTGARSTARSWSRVPLLAVAVAAHTGALTEAGIVQLCRESTRALGVPNRA